MAYMTIAEVYTITDGKGICDGKKWVADNNIQDLKEALDKCQRADWLLWTFILLGYNMDNVMQLISDTMEQTTRHVAYMQIVLNEKDLQFKADLANEIFKDGGKAHCDIIRANTNVIS